VGVIALWNSTTVTLAVEHAGRQDAGGIVTLLFGIGALAIGAPFATNFRGALDRWDETPRRIPAILQKLPPWRWSEPGDDRKFFRIWASFFAIIGIVLIPVGIYRIATGSLIRVTGSPCGRLGAW
jgi:hypothetical protein